MQFYYQLHYLSLNYEATLAKVKAAGASRLSPSQLLSSQLIQLFWGYVRLLGRLHSGQTDLNILCRHYYGH